MSIKYANLHLSYKNYNAGSFSNSDSDEEEDVSKIIGAFLLMFRRSSSLFYKELKSRGWLRPQYQSAPKKQFFKVTKQPKKTNLKFLFWTIFFVGQKDSSDKIFLGKKYSSDKIFVTFEKFRHFCPTLFCPIRYTGSWPQT